MCCYYYELIFWVAFLHFLKIIHSHRLFLSCYSNDFITFAYNCAKNCLLSLGKYNDEHKFGQKNIAAKKPQRFDRQTDSIAINQNTVDGNKAHYFVLSLVGHTYSSAQQLNNIITRIKIPNLLVIFKVSI